MCFFCVYIFLFFWYICMCACVYELSEENLFKKKNRGTPIFLFLLLSYCRVVFPIYSFLTSRVDVYKVQTHAYRHFLFVVMIFLFSFIACCSYIKKNNVFLFFFFLLLYRLSIHHLKINEI